jgi:hypothetical protein
VFVRRGLGDLNSSYIFLRQELFFSPARYYGAIALDFLMRLGWAFVISPDQPYIQQSFMLLLGAVELLRRSMWSIFRVEWEHIQINMKSQLLRAESQMKRMYVPTNKRTIACKTEVVNNAIVNFLLLLLLSVSTIISSLHVTRCVSTKRLLCLSVRTTD